MDALAIKHVKRQLSTYKLSFELPNGLRVERNIESAISIDHAKELAMLRYNANPTTIRWIFSTGGTYTKW